MPGKIVEALNSATQIGFSRRVGTATVFWNGRPATTSAIGIDVAEADEIHFVLNVGQIQGPQATLFNALYASATNDPSTASAIAGASFTAQKVGTGAIEEASILAGSCPGRYVFLRSEVQGTPVTVDFGAVANIRAKVGAVSKTLAFDL